MRKIAKKTPETKTQPNAKRRILKEESSNHVKEKPNTSKSKQVTDSSEDDKPCCVVCLDKYKTVFK